MIFNYLNKYQVLILLARPIPTFLLLVDSVRFINNSFSLRICSFIPIILRFISAYLFSFIITLGSLGSFCPKECKLSIDPYFFLFTLLLESSFLLDF